MDECPASLTVAFVRFGTKLEAKKAMMDSASDGRLRVSRPVKLQKYERSKEDEGTMTEKEIKFVRLSPAEANSILRVTGLPKSTTSAELLALIEAMIGPLTKDDYSRVLPTTALINRRLTSFPRR